MAALPKVIKFSEDGKLFVKSFLIDGSKNINEWRVTADSIPKNIESFVNRPLVLTNDFSHPPLVDKTDFQKNSDYQERFAVGRIRKVLKEGADYFAITEITDPLAKEAIENNDIPFFVSPTVHYDPFAEARDNIQNWRGFHLAIVDKPAYGEQATIGATCTGQGEQCLTALVSAGEDSSCNFCRKTALLKLVNNDSDSSHSSHVQDGKKLQNVMGDNATPTPTVDLSGYVPKADYEAKVAELTALKGAFEQAKTAYDSRLAAIELENTTNKITAILSAKIEDKAELDKKVKYFVEAKVSPDVVAEAFKLVPDVSAKQAAKGKDNSGKFEQASSEKPSNFEQMIAYESRRFA